MCDGAAGTKEIDPVGITALEFFLRPMVHGAWREMTVKALCAGATLLLGIQPVVAQQNVFEGQMKRVAGGACEVAVIACGQTVNGVIDQSDCDQGGGGYLDWYEFQGSVGQKLIIDMTSSALDYFALVVSDTTRTRAFAENGGSGQAHLEYTIGDNPGDWHLRVLANHYGWEPEGVYSLTLQCGPSDPNTCFPDSDTLCIDDRLGDRRFKVEIDFSTTSGGGALGAAHAIQLDDMGIRRGGLFWFFSADNPELLIKVLDGCAINDSFWVFYAAATDVGLTLTVTDTKTGHTFLRTNPDHHPVDTVQATAALPCS